MIIRRDPSLRVCRECEGTGTTWACELPERPHDPWDGLGCDTQVACPSCSGTGVIGL